MLRIFILILLLSCSTFNREKIANDIGEKSSLIKEKIYAKPFLLTAFYKLNKTAIVTNIYIEGDGYAWIDRNTPSPDPTPKWPLALKLASVDPSQNIIYIARPCQYTNLDQRPCPQKFWTSERFASEVISSINEVMDKFKTKFRISSFNIIGFSGGANIAALLTHKRKDIISLRTMAGNLDHELLHSMHNVSQLKRSENAKDIASQISHIPQHHFLGAKDRIITKEILESYIKASGESDCLRSSIIKEVDHVDGWEKNWPSLLERPIDCKN